MSVMMITCPVVLHAVAVSNVMSPVTQLALTAVNAASSGFVNFPFTEENGRVRRIVPIRIKARKPMLNTAVELSFFLLFSGEVKIWTPSFSKM